MVRAIVFCGVCGFHVHFIADPDAHLINIPSHNPKQTHKNVFASKLLLLFLGNLIGERKFSRKFAKSCTFRQVRRNEYCKEQI